MMLQIDARKLKVLLNVLQRAPASEAEQIICQEVAAWLAELAAQTSEEERQGGAANDDERAVSNGAPAA